MNRNSLMDICIKVYNLITKCYLQRTIGLISQNPQTMLKPTNHFVHNFPNVMPILAIDHKLKVN